MGRSNEAIAVGLVSSMLQLFAATVALLGTLGMGLLKLSLVALGFFGKVAVAGLKVPADLVRNHRASRLG